MRSRERLSWKGGRGESQGGGWLAVGALAVTPPRCQDFRQREHSGTRC